jgi:hypothetical protein
MKKKSRTRQREDAQRALCEGSKAGTPPDVLRHWWDQVHELEKPPQVDVCSGEVLPGDPVIRDTLKNPDTAAVDASLVRTALLQKVDALELGIDAAQSVDAGNSLEKMLAHQLAVCHVAAMRIFAEVEMYRNPYSNPNHGQNGQLLLLKKLSMAGRLVDTFQKGLETLVRTRTAGKQVIEVKQIQVNGGQNVIADQVMTGSRNQGRGEKK